MHNCISSCSLEFQFEWALQLQLVPQKVMLDSVMGLQEIHNAGIHRLLGDGCNVNEVTQGGEVMDWRLPGLEAGLDRLRC